MPAVLVTGYTTMQKPPFFPAVAETVTSTHCSYTQGMARLSGLGNIGIVDL